VKAIVAGAVRTGTVVTEFAESPSGVRVHVREHAGAGRLRPDRGRAQRRGTSRVRPGLPVDHAAGRGRAQRPPVA